MKAMGIALWLKISLKFVLSDPIDNITGSGNDLVPNRQVIT